MRKRIITIISVCFFMLILASCGNSNRSEIITLHNEEAQAQIKTQVSKVEEYSNIAVYETKKIEEYLTFLEVFDERNNEILGVTTCMKTGYYSSYDFYMVTYKKLDEPREVRATGKVSVFRTKSEEVYLSFLANFDKSNNEILGISTSMKAGDYSNGDFYIVTFIELK